jgi:SAM-dependent methyltransferase
VDTTINVAGVDVDASNVGQAESWHSGGRFWADHADHFDTAVRVHHDTLMRAGAIQPGDQVLDVGCGAGQTTLDAARMAPTGAALGVDLSDALLEVARTRAAQQGVGNATFLRADAQIHRFGDGRFDLVLSRTGAMFFGDPAAAFANLARALRPGGRLALITWQAPERNEWIQVISGALAAGRQLPAPPLDAPGPFSLADPERVRALLTGAGFAGVELDPLQAPMWFGADAADAEQFILGANGWMLDGLDDAGRDRAQRALRDVVHAHAGPDGVTFASAAWLVTACTATTG